MQKRGQARRSADVAALGRGITALGPVFARAKPNVIFVLGDRIEVMAADAAANIGEFRIARIHGGDRAEGISDESIQHAVTKLAHVHLVATRQSRTRLIRMGEPPNLVFNVGSPAIDGLDQLEPARDTAQLIVIQHPIGASRSKEQHWMRGTLAATRRFDRLILAPNHDPSHEGIRAALAEARLDATEHLSRDQFLSALKAAPLTVGNSSASLIEASALRVSCVNIGPSQAGWEKPMNVIDCEYAQGPIAQAIHRAQTLDLNRMRHPYGAGRAGRNIAGILARLDLAAVSIRKGDTY